MLGLAYLIVFQVLGEVLVELLALPIGGSVVGMLLLLIALVVRGGPPTPLARTSGKLLRHLSLLFIPAGVAIVHYLPLLGEQGFVLVGTLSLGALLLLSISGAALERFVSRS